MEILDKNKLDFEKIRQEEKLADTHNQYRIEMEKSELLLRLAEKFSSKVESTEKEEKMETKTVTLTFKKELLDDIKDIKTKWDEITG